MLRYFFVSFLLVTVAIVSLAGFRGTMTTKRPIEVFPDMDDQPKYTPQHPDRFFADGRAARKPVAGTIPVGYTLPGSYLQAGAKNGTLKPQGFTNQPDYYNTGKFGDVYGDGFPDNLTVDEAFLKRGQQRFNINCAICHNKTGAGDGIIKSYGLTTIISLLDDRIRQLPDGQIFSTLTNGKNTMGAYGPQIAVEDRWAIVAYVRVLQRTTAGKMADLPAALQKELEAKK